MIIILLILILLALIFPGSRKLMGNIINGIIWLVGNTILYSFVGIIFIGAFILYGMMYFAPALGFIWLYDHLANGTAPGDELLAQWTPVVGVIFYIWWTWYMWRKW